jgi:hypothetical protein
MADKQVFCIARDEVKALRILDDLKDSGFAKEEISLVVPEKAAGGKLARPVAIKAAEEGGNLKNAGAAAVVGGWLERPVCLSLPVLGSLTVSGPLANTLKDRTKHATTRKLANSLTLTGIPDSHANRYEGSLREGKILISVHADRSQEACRARVLFERAGADDVLNIEQVSVPGDEVGYGPHRRAT